MGVQDITGRYSEHLLTATQVWNSNYVYLELRDFQDQVHWWLSYSFPFTAISCAA